MHSNTYLLVVAGLSIVVLLLLILKVKLGALLSLLIVSVALALAAGIPVDKVVPVMETGLAKNLGSIALIIVLGAMIGKILEVSNGTERIARWLLGTLGERRAALALGITGMICGFVLFFDVAVILVAPTAIAVARRSGKSVLRYCVPVALGVLSVAALVPPQPAPTAMAKTLGVPWGWLLILMPVCAVPAFAVAYLWSQRVAGRYGTAPTVDAGAEQPAEIDDSELPGLAPVLAVILFPILLIVLQTVLTNVISDPDDMVRKLFSLIGAPDIALLLGVLLGFPLLVLRRGMGRDRIAAIADQSLRPVGTILMVTGCGAVFGAVLVESGVGKALTDSLAGSGLPVLLLAFLLSVLLRAMLGSTTVATMTVSALMADMVKDLHWTAPHLALLVLAIGSGGMALSHFNDPGFWVQARYFDIKESVMLKTWTSTITVAGVVSFLMVCLMSLVVS